ncbi:hypothetical protein EYF80_031830 [Liparis tanakae]|uniref:Uncharacterized protein n=1 Tax=Liparis tanakae TaxID=230148 RepID=A0A4Z2GZ86_9TELE|nr:hypothetical protein EYF80_031830 [Liparis tanakae]
MATRAETLARATHRVPALRNQTMDPRGRKAEGEELTTEEEPARRRSRGQRSRRGGADEEEPTRRRSTA